MTEFKFGKGKGTSFMMSGLERTTITIRDDMKGNTLQEIADQLAKQLKIKNGTIDLIEIDFRYADSDAGDEE